MLRRTFVILHAFQHDFITSTSASREGFKKAKKKTEVAGQTTGIAAGLRALRRDVKQIRIIVDGLGPGRSSPTKHFYNFIYNYELPRLLTIKMYFSVSLVTFFKFTGRFSAINGLKMAGIEIVSISDFSFIPETSGKPKNVRRV